MCKTRLSCAPDFVFGLAMKDVNGFNKGAFTCFLCVFKVNRLRKADYHTLPAFVASDRI